MSERTAPNPAAFYESYQVRYLFAPWSLGLIDRVRPQPGERVLDLACGTGAVARETVKRISPGGSVVGVDISPDMLRVANEIVGTRDGVVQWQQASADSLPLPDASVDVAICQQGLQFFPDKPAALRELRRVLKPGGRVALSVWRTIEHHPVAQAMSTAASGKFGAMIRVSFALGEDGALQRMLEDAGFQSVRVESVQKDIVFPSADEFVANTVRGVAAALPELRAMTDDQRAQLVAAVQAEVAPALRSYASDGELRFPTAAHVATARN